MTDAAHQTYATRRRQMVDCQIRTFDVTDRAVLGAMDEVPREAFVADSQKQLAYIDSPLRVPGGTMLAPMVIARLIQGLDVNEGDRILAIGAGAAYAAAVLSHLGATVVLVPGEAALETATASLAAIGAAGVTVRNGAEAAGAPADGPFDSILIEGGFVGVPEALVAQLREGGSLAGIDMSDGAGKAVLLTLGKVGSGRRILFDAAAPVIGGLAPAPEFSF